jgi:hypothetical protein
MTHTHVQHWHGFFQSGSAWADGPTGVTQCPIVPGNSFLYEFSAAEQAGTFWYHSHFCELVVVSHRHPILKALHQPLNTVTVCAVRWSSTTPMIPISTCEHLLPSTPVPLPSTQCALTGMTLTTRLPLSPWQIGTRSLLLRRASCLLQTPHLSTAKGGSSEVPSPHWLWSWSTRTRATDSVSYLFRATQASSSLLMDIRW